jgi:protein SCO1/2
LLQQRPGAVMSLALPAGDDPVLLVPSYYRCRQLCGLVMHGLLDALKQSGASRWRIVAFSIDPGETAADARARRDADRAYAAFVGLPHAEIDLLTLAPPDIERATREIGFSFSRVGGEFAHPATVVVVTPRGRVSRYFNGVAFDAGELRVALADAAGDRIGAVTSRLALLCAHFDPRQGVHTRAVLEAVRAVSIALVAALGAWVWRHRRGGAR